MIQSGWILAVRRVSLVVAMLAVSGFAKAEAQVVISGTVTSEQGQKLSNANVYINELNVSVATDADGLFTITLTPARLRGASSLTVRARAIGYTPVSKITTATNQTIPFILRQDMNRLSEVIVSGVTSATSQTKVPFSVVHIDADQLNRAPAADPLTALQGKVPGVNIVTASGRPGATPSVLLRAPTSISSNGRGVAPLYVVDGVIIGDQLVNSGGGGLTDINPQDIESVEVIKGAAAASLYGSRAGNGVIAITTKSGKTAPNGIRVSGRSEFGRSDVEHQFNNAHNNALRLDPTGTRFCVNTIAPSGVSTAPYNASGACVQTIDWTSELARVNSGADPIPLSTFAFPVDPGSGLAGYATRNNFQNEKWPGVNYNPAALFIDPGPYQNQSLGITGRTGNTSFYGSGSHTRQQGAAISLQGLTRSTGRVNADHSSGAWTFSLNSFVARDKQDGLQYQDGGQFLQLTRQVPISNLLARDPSGRLFIQSNLLSAGTQQNNNPLYNFENYKQLTTNNRIISGATTTWRPLTWLSLDANLSYDDADARNNYFQDKNFRTLGTSVTVNNSGFLNKQAEENQQLNGSTNIVASKTFGSDFNTRTSFRTLYERADYDYRRLNGNWLQVAGVPNANNIGANPNSSPAIPSQLVTSSATSVRSLGYFVAQDMDWKDGRYVADLLVRRDASSLFGAGHRWSTFGRVALAWNAAQEPWWFMHFADEFKLRGSVGTAGNRPPYAAQYETFNLTNGTLGQASTVGNPSLSPEVVREREFGLDAQFFHRIGLNVTTSHARTTDQILLAPVSGYFGAYNQYRNAGVMVGRNLEASVNVPILTGRDLGYSVRVNYARSSAKITQLNIPEYFFGSYPGQAGVADKLFRARVNEEYGTMYGRVFTNSCSQLPTGIRSACGPGKDFVKNSDGYVVWVGAGNTPADGVSKNLWQAKLPANSPLYGATGNGQGLIPANVAVNWGMPFIVRDSTGSAQLLPIGHALPKYTWSVSQTANYKRLTVSALLDAIKGKSVYNTGGTWSYLDFLRGDEDQYGKSVADAKPLGYFYRASSPDNGNGVGGLYDILGPNTNNVEDASFVKLRELSVGFHIGNFGSSGGDWTATLTGRNLKTWTKYKGWDPEVGFGAISGSGGTAGNSSGSAAINAIDAFTFPAVRTFTFALSASF